MTYFDLDEIDGIVYSNIKKKKKIMRLDIRTYFPIFFFFTNVF